MSIIASLIIAGSTVFTCEESWIEYNPSSDNLELHIIVPEKMTSPKKMTSSDCYVNLTVREYTNLLNQVSALWTAHTNRIAIVEERKKKNAERKSAIERVKNNVDKRKRRSVMPKNAGGVR